MAGGPPFPHHRIGCPFFRVFYGRVGEQETPRRRLRTLGIESEGASHRKENPAMANWQLCQPTAKGAKDRAPAAPPTGVV